jgi:hypothetical protein
LWLGVAKQSTLVVKMAFYQTVRWPAIASPLRQREYTRIIEILKTVGASQENVVKQTIYVVKGQDIRDGYAATQKVWEISQQQLPLPLLKVLAFPDRSWRLKLLR